MVLGPIMETSLRQSLLISRGNFMIFVNRPICAVLIIVTTAFLIWPILKKKRTDD
jgi:putative tricarboxylic transport membrane protein